MSIRYLLKLLAIYVLIILIYVPALSKAKDKSSLSLSLVTNSLLTNHILACTYCHGLHGEGNYYNSYFPRLAGQPVAYLKNQLLLFHNNHRKYGPMNYLTSYLSKEYIYDISIYFSKLNNPINKIKSSSKILSPAMLKRGFHLVTEGDKINKIPACITCHGKKLSGNISGIPGLLGFSPEYLSTQLSAFRNGTRTDQYNKLSNCMNQIALHLSNYDISSISTWLATQKTTNFSNFNKMSLRSSKKH